MSIQECYLFFQDKEYPYCMNYLVTFAVNLDSLVPCNLGRSKRIKISIDEEFWIKMWFSLDVFFRFSGKIQSPVQFHL